jgi:hypothetical protein
MNTQEFEMLKKYYELYRVDPIYDMGGLVEHLANLQCKIHDLRIARAFEKSSKEKILKSLGGGDET